MTQNSFKCIKDNASITVFGASGDLAKKKTFPALFGLFRDDLLPKNLVILGYARSKLEHDDFLKRITQYITVNSEDDKQKLEAFKQKCNYLSGAYDQPEAFETLEKRLRELEGERDVRNRMYYLALPPDVFVPVVTNLKKKCYPENGIMRVIMEKPFGHDLKSAKELQAQLDPLLTEEELYRIDHYLGKEMVKNISFLRFANPVLAHIWNKNSIANVQVTFKESIGTEGRGGYFDSSTIIRDVIQNHLIQVVTLLAMEIPSSFNSEDVRDEKVKVLKRMRVGDIKDIVLGQFTKSEDGSKPGYLDDKTVPEGSRCPTFAAIPFFIDNERWKGVPFLLKAGKALNQSKVEIRIQLKDSAAGLFDDIYRNELVIRIQPDEAVYMKVNVKYPGLRTEPILTELDLTYSRRFENMKINEAYEALLLAAFRGDQSNFVRSDELEYAWGILDPVLSWLDNDRPEPLPYTYGSRGPAALDEFMQKFGFVHHGPDSYQYPTTRLSL
ncbi:glucose-6-phosphate 1-dehydrogenase [Schizosaccharomyces japonicus yFS275]|uniref:Glucose-6-phosphate 1-dehydrogenase n=1 Tax=Schizosaccharomyces japonicus (strain yFS275 / FY16936) TaxID=402676 RepID=B6K233_SCHJY|nr:glucose-6-phosphate 1-dehydrogenase [Schizosaccharomyces japonicus yFS275]EEB07214.1 glucose-6-phosphate 1-dehydrogenase [Schizosaccharomyces japonicus yFS275]